VLEALGRSVISDNCVVMPLSSSNEPLLDDGLEDAMEDLKRMW
jgi:hypothetical protein